MTTQTKGVSYIVNSKKPYPDWIKNHSVFKEMNKIDKIFPKIGLPNFKEPCDIMNSAEALAEAVRLGNKLFSEMARVQGELYTKLGTALKLTGKDRDEICADIQGIINLLGSVMLSIQKGDYAKVVEGKVVLRLGADIFGAGKAPVFRKDEAILRVVGKLWDMIDKHKLPLTKTDQYQEFKDFSRVNIPNKKYIIAFSSTGEDGAWDIGTISMRGITSCQSWNAPQSRGLIGSISSKFVGVIYMASEQDIPGYGSKMLNRSMVRFAINKATKKPALIIDRIYPNDNKDTRDAFKKVLKDKSGLEVLCTYENNGSSSRAADLANYYIPDEPCRNHLRQGEFSYMDYQIQVQPHSAQIKKTPANLTERTNGFKKRVAEDINKEIAAKREVYINASKAIEGQWAEYEAAKKKWGEENANKPESEQSKFELRKPRLEPELHAFGKGGIINLLTHCDKKHGAGAGGVFVKLILDSIEVEHPDECTSKEEYHRKYLMTFLKNPSKIKETAKKKYSTGTWMKSFPKSSERFFETIFGQMKGYVVASCKEMIKKSN
jgi:hypothetical protein